MAKPSTSKFVKMNDPQDRASAQRLLNNFKSRVAGWQRSAALLKHVYNDSVQIWDYIGYSDTDLGQYETYWLFAYTVEYRLKLIDQRVKEVQSRDEATQRARAARVRSRKKSKTGKAPRGRPKLRALTYGQYVYLLTVYNHGRGPLMMEFDSSQYSDEPALYGPVEIEDWS